MGGIGYRSEGQIGSLRSTDSIWINDQWRICFVWKAGDAHEVEIVDYHDLERQKHLMADRLVREVLVRAA